MLLFPSTDPKYLIREACIFKAWILKPFLEFFFYLPAKKCKICCGKDYSATAQTSSDEDGQDDPQGQSLRRKVTGDYKTRLSIDAELTKDMDGRTLDFLCPKIRFGCTFEADCRAEVDDHMKVCRWRDEKRSSLPVMVERESSKVRHLVLKL